MLFDAKEPAALLEAPAPAMVVVCGDGVIDGSCIGVLSISQSRKEFEVLFFVSLMMFSLRSYAGDFSFSFAEKQQTNKQTQSVQ